MKKTVTLITLILLCFSFLSCDLLFPKKEGPNEISGDTNLAITQPGNQIGFTMTLDGSYQSATNNIHDSLVITKNDNGIVTTHGEFSVPESTLLQIDTLFGTQTLTRAMKVQIILGYLQPFNGKIDTSNKQNMKLSFDLVMKFTSEGIQDFKYSNSDLSKPFTIVKYSDNVGDSYTFTGSDGKTITRTITSKASVEDWSLGYLIVKSMKTEQIMTDDPMIQKIVYVTNHKYGLVGAILTMKNGKVISVSLLPLSV